MSAALVSEARLRMRTEEDDLQFQQEVTGSQDSWAQHQTICHYQQPLPCPVAATQVRRGWSSPHSETFVETTDNLQLLPHEHPLQPLQLMVQLEAENQVEHQNWVSKIFLEYWTKNIS